MSIKPKQKKNARIREALQRCDIKQWELADLLKISECTMCVKLRKELSEDETNIILMKIQKEADRRKGVI